MTHEVAVIPGDGIGGEVIPAATRVLRATPVDIDFVRAAAGDETRADTGEALPEETRSAAASADATLFGAAGETAADVILPLREVVGSYANVRPVRTYPGVDALASDTDLVFVRENTEGVYAGIESTVTEGVRTLTRVTTEAASERIAEFGFSYAAQNGYDQVTVAHKANVMRRTDGLFLECVRRVGEDRGMSYETVLMDALAMHLVMRPGEYGVIICPNLAGDVLSDLAAGLVDLDCCRRRTSGRRTRCLNRSTAPHPISPARVSPTRWRRFSLRRCYSNISVTRTRRPASAMLSKRRLRRGRLHPTWGVRRQPMT